MYRALNDKSLKQLVAAKAAGQAGVVHWRQLIELGVADSTISYWGLSGYLHRVLPKVYSVG